MKKGESKGERAMVPGQEAPSAPAQPWIRAQGKEILGAIYYLPRTRGHRPWFMTLNWSRQLALTVGEKSPGLEQVHIHQCQTRALPAGNQILQKEVAVNHQGLALKSKSISKKKKNHLHHRTEDGNFPVVKLPKSSPEWPVRGKAFGQLTCRSTNTNLICSDTHTSFPLSPLSNLHPRRTRNNLRIGLKMWKTQKV